MSTSINRRKWLRSTALLTAGLVATPSLRSLSARSQEEGLYQVRVWEHAMASPPGIDQLKARLLANENPYGPSDKVRLAIMESCAMGNRYGHGDAARLIDMIAEKEGVPKEYILLGPGSTDLLEKTAIVQFRKGGNIVSGDPAYMSLIKTALAFDAEWKRVPLLRDYAHDLDAMAGAVDGDTRLVYICNPNNPTGTITPAGKLRAFCAAASEQAPVFVDEAYLEFLNDPEASSMIDLVRAGKDVIISRTFSKIHGMAGLRIGYIVALPERIEKISSMVRGTMGLCVTSLRGAIASMEDTVFQANSQKWTAEAREYVYGELEKMGFDYIPSHTSFILFPIDMPGKDFLEKMYAEGVGVRAFEIDDKPYCRVSMGTKEELALFASSLKKVLA